MRNNYYNSIFVLLCWDIGDIGIIGKIGNVGNAGNIGVISITTFVCWRAFGW